MIFHHAVGSLNMAIWCHIRCPLPASLPWPFQEATGLPPASRSENLAHLETALDEDVQAAKSTTF